MAEKKAHQTKKSPRITQPEIKSGTLVIVTNFGGDRNPYEFGVIAQHTAGDNWMVATQKGKFIYSQLWIYPILETDGQITDAKLAWAKYMPQFLGVIVDRLKNMEVQKNFAMRICLDIVGGHRKQ